MKAKSAVIFPCLKVHHWAVHCRSWSQEAHQLHAKGRQRKWHWLLGHESCRASTALSPIHGSYLELSVKGTSMWNYSGLLWPQRLPEIILATGSNLVPCWDDPAQAGRWDQVTPCGPFQLDPSCDSVTQCSHLCQTTHLCYLIAQALPLSNMLLNRTVHQAVRCPLRYRLSLSGRKGFIPEAMNFLLQKNLNWGLENECGILEIKPDLLI